MTGHKCTQHALCSHGILPDDEVHELQQSVCALETELGDVEMEMADIERRLSTLKVRRRAIWSALGVRRARLAPVQCLPPEILGEIFLQSVDCDKARLGDHTRANHDQLSLLRVCKRWHNIALTIPALWSSLTLWITKPFTNGDVASLGAWLARSKACTLELQMGVWNAGPIRDDPDWVRSMEMILELVLCHVERCSHLSLRFPPASATRMLASKPNGLPRLEQLSIQLDENFRSGQVLVDFSIYTRLSALYCSSRFQQRSIVFRGQGAGVREVQTDLSIDETMDLLTRCPSVTKYTLAFVTGVLPQDVPMLQLSHLSELICWDADHVASMFDRLGLPSLQILTLEAKGEGGHRAWPHLAQLLQRSCPPLTNLTVIRCAIDEASLIRSLAWTPNLRTLTIDGQSLSTAFWRALTMMRSVSLISFNGQTRNVCPELETLELRCCQGLSGSAPIIAEMVFSRCAGGAKVGSSRKPLKAVCLHKVFGQRDGMELLSCPGIRNCINGGLNIRIDYR